MGSPKRSNAAVGNKGLVRMRFSCKVERLGWRHLFSIFFMLAIILPVLLALAGISEPGPKASPRPALHWGHLLDSEYYHAWGQYIDRRLPAIGPVTRAKRWLDYHLFRTSDRSDVYVGRSGWLFTGSDIHAYRRDACRHQEQVVQLIFQLDTIAHLIKASGRQFFFTVAPAKSTIYPEFVGKVPKDPECRQSLYELLIEAQKENRLACFIRLDNMLREAKNADRWLYAKTGATWNENGAAIAARALKREILKDIFPAGDTSTDLAEVLLDAPGPQNHPVPDTDTYQRSSMVVYGGAAINAVLPELARPFSRIDAIASDIIPSANHGENLSAYDTIAVIVDEASLPDLQFDLDGLCRMLSVEGIADDRKSVPLKTCSPERRLALEWIENRLAVKSLGAEGFFRLPHLPGSDDGTLRILAVDVTAPAADELAWGLVQQPDRTNTNRIRAGKSRLYLPLPVQPALNLHINPGRSTGLYYFSNAKLLEYKNGISTSVATASTDYTVAPEDETAVEADLAQPAPSTPASPPITTAPAPEAPKDLKLNDFEDLRVFQRTGTAADIMISGTFSGQAQNVEARIVRHSDGTPVSPWRVIDSNPGNGIFMGIMAEVPQGGWYRMQARFPQSPQDISQGQTRWGVGMLVACIGQSNMKEMFYAGDDLNAHALLSLHRKGRWRPVEEKGNGAIALGNRLIAKLGIPVGLLDYAVNGSGLRQEADWGTGYWADRSEKGIFSAFAKGVAATGGALEYVVWLQGEADAARGTISGNQYRSALTAFIEQQVRPAFTNGSQLEHLPFLVISMAKRPGGRDMPNQKIREALSAVTREVPDCYLAAITVDLKSLGRQHLVPSAYTTIGLRVAQTILYLLGEETYYRGPSIAGAQKVNNDTIQVNLVHRGGYDFSPTTGITGWQALDHGAHIAVKEVWRHDSRSLRLKLGQAVHGPLNLKYLFGAAPDATGAIHDNSAMELPLEPAEVEAR